MRNIILVTGPFADGKTKLIGVLQKEFRTRGIPFEQKIISDSPYMLEAVSWDDRETGGLNHMHSENGRPEKHVHESGKALDFDFVVTGYAIQKRMFANFFRDLSRPRFDDKWYFAELAGGVNIHSSDHPAYLNDYSYKMMTQELRSRAYENAWINNLAYVIHPEVLEFSCRIDFNNGRKKHLPTAEEVELGTDSWPLPDIVMKNTGEDDFSFFQEYLVSRGFPQSWIENIPNGGNPEFFGKAMKALERQEIVPPEGQSARKEMR